LRELPKDSKAPEILLVVDGGKSADDFPGSDSPDDSGLGQHDRVITDITISCNAGLT